MKKENVYTKKDLVNLLMLFEEDYAEDYKNDAEGYMSGKTPKEWVNDCFNRYNNMDKDELISHYREVNGNILFEWEDGYDDYYEQNMAVLEDNKNRLWVK